MFQEYRETYEAMEAEPAVRRARKAIEDYRASLAKLEAPYRQRMEEAEKAIVAAVLPGKASVTLFGVKARFTKGRKSTTWKALATIWKPSQRLIAEYTKVGAPRVSVGSMESWEGEADG